MQKALRQYFSELGKKSANKMTPEQRKERASKAGQKRWENYKAKQK